jgi:hypothetical protein
VLHLLGLDVLVATFTFRTFLRFAGLQYLEDWIGLEVHDVVVLAFPQDVVPILVVFGQRDFEKVLLAKQLLDQEGHRGLGVGNHLAPHRINLERLVVSLLQIFLHLLHLGCHVQQILHPHIERVVVIRSETLGVEVPISTLLISRCVSQDIFENGLPHRSWSRRYYSFEP